MRDDAALDRLVPQVVALHGRLDGVVNNAGIAPAGKFADQDPAIWRDTLAVNVLASMQPDRVRRLIRHHGAERVIFGSDWPMTSPAAELAALRALGLRDEEFAAIVAGNLARILRVP